MSLLAGKYEHIRGLMKNIFVENYDCYGYRRMYQALIGNRILASEKLSLSPSYFLTIYKNLSSP